jgi:nucleoid DNA-binding protein
MLVNHRPWLRGILICALSLPLAVTAPVQSQRPPKEETLAQRLARAAKVKDDQATKVLDALGPVIRDELQQGRQVPIPGLGTFRVVRVAEHRDLRDGRPVVIPATNTIEFLPEGVVTEVANAEGARPAETVPAFRYIVLPGQTPAQKMGSTRAPNVRTR